MAMNTAWWVHARRFALAGLFAQGLVACAPAPVVVALPAPVPESFRESVPNPNAAHTAAAPANTWWQVFADPQLDALMQRALQGNPGLQQASARVARAAAALNVSASQLSPQLNSTVGATRQLGPLVNAAGNQGNLFNADARLRYDVDLLHKLSRGQQSAWHDLQAEQALQRQAQLVLQAEVTQNLLAWRALRLEQRALDAVLQADRALLAVAERRVQAGLAAVSVRSAAQADVLTDEAEAQGLARRLALLEHALAALCGAYGDAPTWDQADEGAWPALPDIPPGLPSHMLQRRPDVAAADQALQAARLRLGLARDAWFPNLVLTANGGLASSELNQWLKASARSAGLGLVLSLPGLDGGRADAERAAAAAVLDGATADHRDKVLQALREVDDQLATLRTLAAEAQVRRAGAEDAERDAARATGQWQRGLTGEAEALLARRAAQRQQRLWLQVQAQQRLATVALVRALGGGWGTEPGAMQRTALMQTPP